MQPLLVHLVFHPESTVGRSLAIALQETLNNDSVVTGLNIPTVYTKLHDASPPSQFPHTDHQAERHFSVVFADIDLADDDAWCNYVASIWQRAQKGKKQRCIPVQCEEHCWPLHEKLEGTNFIRAVSTNPVYQSELVVRCVLIELCRFLHGDAMGDEGASAPTKLFLSHTKLDIDSEPRVVEKLNQYLKADQPIDVWYDSGDIPGGSAFEKEINNGIKDSSLLCVLTDNYASREWCRKEILLAKDRDRPLVVLNALQHCELRSFPYLGNVPVIRWDGRPELAIDTLLKETARHMHVMLVLGQFKKNKDVVLTRPPELLSLRKLKANTSVLYPEPPLSNEEKQVLVDSQIKLSTPLERLGSTDKLVNKTISLSTSSSNDIEMYGFAKEHQERFVLDLSKYLIIKGVKLLYGGHLGDQGYTAKLVEMVRAYNPSSTTPDDKVLLNYVGWPVPMNKRLRVKYKQIATLKRIARPAGVSEKIHNDFIKEPTAYFPAETSVQHRFAWARGMTKLRENLTQDSHARIVIGGNIGATEQVKPDGNVQHSWYSGCLPGVVEEVLLSIKMGQPVFLLGAFGGAAAVLIDLIEGKHREEMTWDYQSKAPYTSELYDLYKKKGLPWQNYDEIVTDLSKLSLKKLNPLLTISETKELFHCCDAYRCAELIIKGVGKL